MARSHRPVEIMDEALPLWEIGVIEGILETHPEVRGSTGFAAYRGPRGKWTCTLAVERSPSLVRDRDEVEREIATACPVPLSSSTSSRTKEGTDSRSSSITRRDE
jgi:hypothetical protein